MTIFAQNLKNVDHEITELKQRLNQLQEYRQQLNTVEETTKSSLQSLSEAMRGLKPEDAETVKREVTRWLGLDDMPTTDSTIETDSPSSNGNHNGASSESETTTDSGTASTTDNSDNGNSTQSDSPTASSQGDNGSNDGEDENGVVKHEYFPDEYVQIFDKSHHYNGRVCLIKKLVRTGYYCVLEPRTDEQGGETEELLLKPHQVTKYQDYGLTADGLDDAPKFPTFKEDQRVWVKQDGKEFKHQGQIVQLFEDGTAKVKLDGYSNPITIAQKDIKDASKKQTQAPSSG